LEFKRTPKSFDLSKIWAKSQKNFGKIPENLGKNGAQHLQKTNENLFLEVTPQKVLIIFVGENVWGKEAQKLFGQVWKNSSKNPSHSQKFACSYTYA